MKGKRKNLEGKAVYVVDVRVKNRTTGVSERYRRDAKVQTARGRDEERNSVVAHYFQYGTIAALLGSPLIPNAAPSARTWDDALALWRRVALPHLKASTARGYAELFSAGFDSWKGIAIPPAPGFVQTWDAAISELGGDSRRRNFHVALRSVLRAAADAGWFDVAELARLPRLPRVGRKEVLAADANDVAKILSEQEDATVRPRDALARQNFRLAVALASFAGLRASEIRALRWADVDLKARSLLIRASMCEGVRDETKSGDERSIPIAPPLLAILKPRASAPGAYVAARVDGSPWGDAAILHALQRACARLEIPRGKVHALRHYFATSRFAHGADARTVMALLGHGSLDVTMRYAHTDEERKRAAVESW